MSIRITSGEHQRKIRLTSDKKKNGNEHQRKWNKQDKYQLSMSDKQKKQIKISPARSRSVCLSVLQNLQKDYKTLQNVTKHNKVLKLGIFALTPSPPLFHLY